MNAFILPFGLSSSVAVFLTALSGACTTGAAGETFRFHHENILGTSLDIQVAASDAGQAGLAENAVLGEIERLRRLLSGYDPASEISRLNHASSPVTCSRETLDVLRSYDRWQEKSGGAYSGHLGSLIQFWKNSEKTGTPPTAGDLQPILAELAAPAWKIDPGTASVTRLSSPGTLDLNSLGKGYIIDKASAAARASAPGITGILVNIGGDIHADGHSADGGPWIIGIADPMHSEDNATPLARVRLSDRAISTSAAYERGFTTGGRRYSHILDPRDGRPAEGVASATVIAGNNTDANAMATTLCVLKPEEGLALVRSVPGVECLIVTADGRQLRSRRFAELETTKPAPAERNWTVSAGNSAWPAGYQVSIGLDLKQPAAGRKKPKRPYVAVWVEDAAGKRVRTITVWGRERKYLPELRAWWKEAKADTAWAATVTRATRGAGQHRIAWDGLDDHGKALPQGTYTVVIEANREHGGYAIKRGTIDCAKTPANGTIPASTEFGESRLSYGPSGT